MTSLSEIADPDRRWPSYRLYFTPHTIAPLDVEHVRSPSDRRVLDAVVAHVQARWRGAPLQVRINSRRCTGRVFAGSADHRLVAGFKLLEHGPDGPPPRPIGPPAPRLADDTAGESAAAGWT